MIIKKRLIICLVLLDTIRAHAQTVLMVFWLFYPSPGIYTLTKNLSAAPAITAAKKFQCTPTTATDLACFYRIVVTTEFSDQCRSNYFSQNSSGSLEVPLYSVCYVYAYPSHPLQTNVVILMTPYVIMYVDTKIYLSQN